MFSMKPKSLKWDFPKNSNTSLGFTPTNMPTHYLIKYVDGVHVAKAVYSYGVASVGEFELKKYAQEACQKHWNGLLQKQFDD